MRFRDVIKDGFYEFMHAFNEYKLNQEVFNKRLIAFYVRALLVMLYPLTPHFSEVMSQTYLKHSI